MTKQVFELIAQALRAERAGYLAQPDNQLAHDALVVVDAMAVRLANDLAKTNPCFKRDVFLKATQ